MTSGVTRAKSHEQWCFTCLSGFRFHCCHPYPTIFHCHIGDTQQTVFMEMTISLVPWISWIILSEKHSVFFFYLSLLSSLKSGKSATDIFSNGYWFSLKCEDSFINCVLITFYGIGRLEGEGQVEAPLPRFSCWVDCLICQNMKLAAMLPSYYVGHTCPIRRALLWKQMAVMTDQRKKERMSSISVCCAMNCGQYEIFNKFWGLGDNNMKVRDIDFVLL